MALAAARLFMGIYSNPAIDWAIVARLRAMTRLPIVLKGITHPDDARLALDQGVDGIVVSNHGGRQVDGAVGAATVLAEVAPLVAGEFGAEPDDAVFAAVGARGLRLAVKLIEIGEGQRAGGEQGTGCE